MGFTPRRAFIKSGAVLVASVTGLIGAARGGLGDTGTSAAAELGPSSQGAAKSQLTRLYGSNWHFASEARSLGELPAPGTRGAVYGELLDAPDGTKVGEFYSASFWVGSPFGESHLSAQ